MRTRPRALSARIGSPFRPSCVGLGGLHRTTRTAVRRACLRRDLRRPETPSIGSGPRPCDRGGTLRANWFVCTPRPGTRSRAAMGSAAVRGGGSPPHATPPAPDRLSAPVPEMGKMLLTDFCNRFATCAPDGSFDSRGGGLACARFTTSDGAETPADDSGRRALDGALRASVERGHTPADPAGADATRSCRVLDRNRTHRWRPPFHGVVFRGRAERVDL